MRTYPLGLYRSADRQVVSVHGGQCCREAELCGLDLRGKFRTVRFPMRTYPLGLYRSNWRGSMRSGSMS